MLPQPAVFILMFKDKPHYKICRPPAQKSSYGKAPSPEKAHVGASEFSKSRPSSFEFEVSGPRAKEAIAGHSELIEWAVIDVIRDLTSF